MRSTVNISLPKDLKENIDKQVEEGDFSSRSELVRAALRRWQEKETLKRIYKSKEQAQKGEAEKLDSVGGLD